MKSYPQQVTDSIPEFFFVWSTSEKKMIYLSESNNLPRQKLSNNSPLESVRNLIAQESRMAFDKMFDQINQGNFFQDMDFATSQTNQAKYFNIKTYPIRDNVKTTKVAGQVLDISKRLEKERRIIGQSQKMEDIMHILAHDLRGPLGNIINLAHMQLENGELNEIKSFSEVIVRLGNETNRLIASMIEMAELESGNFQLAVNDCDLQEYLYSIVSPYKSELQEKKIKLITDFPKKTININIDMVKFRLVIQNLISNAVKFTRENGSILLKIEEKDSDLKIILHDDGIGIPEEKIGQLFEKFSSARRKGIRGEKSTGLGLSITKKIVELHGGSIEVNSIVDDGTEFIISLKRSIKDPAYYKKTQSLNTSG